MTPKKIPRVVRIFLLLMGGWMGALATMILLAISLIVPLVTWILVAFFSIIILLYALILTKYRTTLEEWDLLEPRKEKKKK